MIGSYYEPEEPVWPAPSVSLSERYIGWWMGYLATVILIALSHYLIGMDHHYTIREKVYDHYNEFGSHIGYTTKDSGNRISRTGDISTSLAVSITIGIFALLIAMSQI